MCELPRAVREKDHKLGTCKQQMCVLSPLRIQKPKLEALAGLVPPAALGRNHPMPLSRLLVAAGNARCPIGFQLASGLCLFLCVCPVSSPFSCKDPSHGCKAHPKSRLRSLPNNICNDPVSE